MAPGLAGAISAGTATLEAFVRHRLRNDILSGELRPGEKLRIRPLCDRYEVGATPIREALSKLVPEGLVLALQNKGFIVSPLTIEELRDITQLRQIIEGQAFQLAIENGDDRWEGEVVASYHRLSRAVTDPLPDPHAQRLAWEQRHKEFHLALISACGNRKLLRFAESLYSLLVRYRQILQLDEMTGSDLLAIHQRLVDAALDRKGKLAASLMADHVHVNVASALCAARRNPERLEACGLKLDDATAGEERSRMKSVRSR
jgi:DNA-binding GntR family transcriptional regulator